MTSSGLFVRCTPKKQKATIIYYTEYHFEENISNIVTVIYDDNDIKLKSVWRLGWLHVLSLPP